MAKEKGLTPLKKGKAEFNLIGKAKISDFTFKLDNESKKSDWIYNQANLGIDCGEHGVIYADMMGGYGADRENKVFVHGKKKDDEGKVKDDFDTRFEIAWEDRFDEETLETVGDMCFLTVGLEKDEKDKTVYRKFLSQYDAIQYINDCLTEGAIVNVKGNLKYSVYNEAVQVKKEITSIALSKAEEKDFKATFTQTVFLDSTAIGKVDKDTMTIPITGMVLDFVKEFDGKKVTRMVNGKQKEGCNLPLVKPFLVKVPESAEAKEKLNKFLKFFKAKPKKITQFTVDGIFSKGDLKTVDVSEDDIPDDIKELIDMGYIDKEEIMSKMAFANGGGKRPEMMFITKPFIKMVGEDSKLPTMDRDETLYTEDDLTPALIIAQLGAKVEDEEVYDEEKLMDEALKEMEKDDDSGDDWLSDLG